MCPFTFLSFRLLVAGVDRLPTLSRSLSSAYLMVCFLLYSLHIHGSITTCLFVSLQRSFSFIGTVLLFGFRDDVNCYIPNRFLLLPSAILPWFLPVLFGLLARPGSNPAAAFAVFRHGRPVVALCRFAVVLILDLLALLDLVVSLSVQFLRHAFLVVLLAVCARSSSFLLCVRYALSTAVKDGRDFADVSFPPDHL